MSHRAHQATFVQSTSLAQDTMMYIFSPEEPVRFRPGQFISVRVGLDQLGHPILRSYSLASNPEEHYMTLVVKLIGQGVGTRYFSTLRRGDKITFTGPMGFFVNELFHMSDVVYAATGTGLAPIYPMIIETLRRKENGRVYLFWGLRTEKELFYREELAILQGEHKRFCATVCFSQEEKHRLNWARHGRIQGPIRELLPHLVKPVFYLCGNGQMINDLKLFLQENGLDRKRQIRTESFFD